MSKKKILSLMFISLIGISFSGCVEKECKPVKVPVKCKVPLTECNKYKYTGESIYEELLMCIKEYKKNSEVCQ